MTNIVFFAKLDKVYREETMTAVQTGVQEIENWNHFNAGRHLHLQMETKFLPHVSILFAAILLAWYFDTFDFGLFKYTSKKKGDAVDELLKKKHQVIGKECIPDTNTCFLIVDSFYLENGRLTTKRDLLLEENTEYSLTGVEVESTKPVSFDNLNSRDWAVNKVVINSRYARLLVASGFIMESLTFDENDHHDVLIAGLGGGVMSNFLSEISYLNIDTTVVENEEFIISIAENYFGHAETNEMRVVHADVVDFLRKYDKKYDVIIVDACENKKSDVMCPVSNILKKETVQLLKKRLTRNGSLAVNVYITQNAAKTEKEILELFSNEFNSCFFLEYFKDKKFREALFRFFRDRPPVEDHFLDLRVRILQIYAGVGNFQFRVDMLNQQQHNQAAPQLLNVQRPHQIQPPSQHRIAPQGQGMQQNQMQQGQNMGQPQMQQQQRSVIQSGPSTSQQMQPQQGQMMNMGQQMRQHQNQPQQQQQMMHNPQQPQQMQRNPQQQQMRNVPQQGQQMQHQQQQQPQMAQMRTQQNQQNMNVPQQQPQQQQQRMPVQNMQQNQQGMRMVQPQTQQQPRMQAPPQQHQFQQMQQQGGNQNMNRPSPQPMQMQQGGQQNINRPPSQQMQHAQPQTVNRPAPHMNNMPVLNQIMSRPPLQLPPVSQTAASQQLYRTQQMQLIQQRMNSESPQQSQQQMHQEQQNVNGQQQMQMQQQHRDPQMQHGQSPVNEAQHQVQVAQVPPKQQNVQPQQRLQMPPQQQQNIRGPVHNSPQNQQMRMAQPQQHQQNRNQQHQQNQQQQPPQQQGHQNQPIRPAPQMVQNRQIAPNQRQQQQLQQQQSLPMQQQNIQQPVQQQPMHQQVHQQQQIQQPQPIHRPQPMKQEQPQVSQANTFEPDNGQTIRINGEHAIINGLQYKLIQLPQSLSPQGQMQHGQQSHQNHQQTPPGQHMQQVPQQQAPNMQQRGQNNQMPVHQPQQQLLQHQQNVPNQQMTPNQQNRQNQPNQHNQQNQQHQSNMPNQQTPPALQQQQAPPSKSSKPRSRSKKASGGNSTPSLHHNTPTADSPSNQRLTPNNNSNMMPSTSSAVPIKSGRKILPPELTPLNAQTPPHNQNESMLRSDSPQQPRMVQQGKHQVQVGGYPPNRDMITPVKSETRNRTPTKMSVHPNQRSGGRSRALQPSSRIRPPGNKVSLMEIQEAIAEHIKGIRKMTPEYEQFVEDELERLLCEMEILELTEDRRYYAVQRLIVLCRGDNVSTIKTPEKEPRCDQQAPTEEEIVEPIDETPEKRKSRYDGYMEKLKEAYPPTTHNAQVCGVDEETIRKETMFYREQDMQEREAYLRKNVDKLPKDKQTKAKIEYLGISLRDFQNQVRKDVLATTTLVPPTEFLINPWSIRRTKNEYMQELRQHPDRAILEKKRKTVNFVFLQSLAKHTREFKEFHKRNLVNHTKVRKSMQTYITNEAKRVAREEMKNEKNRIQKLIQEDEEGYRAMLDEKKDRRLVYLLEQTDDYIKSLCDLLKQQQSNTAGNSMVKHTPRKNYDGLAEEDKVKSILDKARNDEDEYENKAAKMNIEDYYATAHGVREVITEQHSTMGGGNPTLKLKPYQLKGLEWMVSLYNNNLNGILADEMGLGKTIQTIAFITYMMEIKKNSGPFLVIVPLSTIPNWKNEFEKWAPDVHMIVYKGTKDVRKFHEPAIKAAKFNVLLTTFEYVIREKGLLGKLRWKYMMIDEGHRLKNQHCKLTEMLNTRFQCQRRLLITGTPLQNKLPELWALLNFLLPSIFSSCSTFEQWFNAPFATTGEKVELTGEETMLIIRRLHKVLRPFLLRRLKKEVESELPDKMEFVIKCEMSGLQKVLYKHMQKGLLLDGKTNTGSRSLMNTMVHLRKLCNHPFLFENVEDSCKAYWDSKFISAVDLYRVSGKLELLDRILPKLHATGHRVLMFFQMTAMMTVVEDYLAGTSINYLRLDGSTKPDDRGLLLDKFNAPNSKYFLFMLSTRAGGLGLNLQTADTVVIFDSDWNPHQDMQAQDRAHRIGQKAEVRVFRLITANSVEEKILASARFKLNVDEKVIQAGKFDNRSTGAERKQILEQIIKAENESDEDEDVPNDEEINDILSRSEEEFETFQKMDQNRYDHDKRINAKPRLCGDDEIPKDILRAADETDCIEKAKEEGLVTHMEVMPGSRRSRKEVDYSIDTMSDDKFLEKLFDGDDATSSKPEQQPVETPEPKPAKPALKLASPQPGPSSETPKRVVSETPAAPEAFVTPKLPPLTFKVPKLLIKSVEELNRKHKLSEGDSSDLSSRKTLKLDDEEKEKEEDYALKRKSFPPIGKIKIKFGGEQFEKLLTMNDETTPPTKTDEKEKKSRKEEKSRKRRNEDGSTPKKRKHRDQDGEGSSEKKKKHKHKHHEHDDELSTSSVQTPSPLFPLKIRVKPMSESPLKSNDSSSSTMSTPSLDKTSSEESFQTPGLGFPLKIRVKPMNESPLKSYDSDFSSKSAPSLDESPVLGLPLKIRVKPMAESSVKSQESDSSTKSAQRLDKSPSKSKRKHDDDSKSHQKKSRKHDEDSPAKPRSKKKRDSDSSSKSDQKKEPLFPLKIRVKPFDESLLKSQESDSSSKSAEKHNEESLSHKKLDTESPLKIRIKPIIDDVFLNTPETDSSSKSAKKHHDSKSKSHRKHDEGSSLTSPKKPEMENPLKIRIKPIIDDSSLKTPETDSSSKSAEKGHHSSSKSHRKHEESSSSHKKPVTETPLKIRVKPIIDDPYQMIVDRETSKSLEQLNESHRKNDEPSSTSSHKKPSMEAPLKIRVKPIIDDPYQRIVDAESSKPAEKLEESHRKHEDPSLASSHKKPSMEAPLKIRVKPIIDDPYQRIVDAELSKSVEKLTESSHHSHTKPAMESPVKIRVKPIIDDSTLKTPETDSSSKTPEKVKESSSKSHRKHGDGSSHKSHKDKNKDSSKMSDHEQDKEFPFKIRIKPIDDSALTSETRESPVKTVENTGETLSKSQPQKEAVLSKPEQKTDVPLKKHNQEPSMTSATSEPSSETTKKLEESPPKPALDTSNEPLPKFTFKLNNSLPLKEASEPSTSSMEPAASQPTLKLKLNFKLPTAEPITSVNGAEPKSDEPKKESNEKTETPKKEKEHKKHHKDKKEHKEHKKKSREGETEEERRARKEAKRLKHQKSGQDDDVKRQEKAARKAARKEQKRLDKEKLAAGSVIQEAVQQDSIAQETPNQEAVAQPAAGSA